MTPRLDEWVGLDEAWALHIYERMVDSLDETGRKGTPEDAWEYRVGVAVARRSIWGRPAPRDTRVLRRPRARESRPRARRTRATTSTASRDGPESDLDPEPDEPGQSTGRRGVEGDA